MDLTLIFSYIGKLVYGVAGLAGLWWGVEKWRRRDEHFPRVYFEVDVKFIGKQDGKIVVELLAYLENKGVVPLTIKEFRFKLLGIADKAPLHVGDERIRGQLDFSELIAQGEFVPESWEGTFVYPGIRTEYSFVSVISETISFIRMQADFTYLDAGRSHHAAKVLDVPGKLRKHSVVELADNQVQQEVTQPQIS